MVSAVAQANWRIRKFLLFIQIITWCGGLIDSGLQTGVPKQYTRLGERSDNKIFNQMAEPARRVVNDVIRL